MNAAQVDFVEIIIFLVVVAVQTGILYNTIGNMREMIKTNRDDFDDHVTDTHKQISSLSINHQTLHLSVVNAPTKDDIKNLSTEVQALKLTLVRLEVILEHIANTNGISVTSKKKHTET